MIEPKQGNKPTDRNLAQGLWLIIIKKEEKKAKAPNINIIMLNEM